MRVFTTYAACDYTICGSDMLLLFSDNGVGLTFSQIHYLEEARRNDVPFALATVVPMGVPYSHLGGESYVFHDTNNIGDAQLVLNALIEEYGLNNQDQVTTLGCCSKLAEILRSSGSPIETKLILAICLMMGSATWVFSQHPIGSYRADVAIIYENHKIVVEADGHDFHERTKEQAQHDKKRDREMQTLGWRVMRFTGSEIWNDPSGCASQVQELLHALMRGAA